MKAERHSKAIVCFSQRAGTDFDYEIPDESEERVKVRKWCSLFTVVLEALAKNLDIISGQSPVLSMSCFQSLNYKVL